MGGDGRRGVRCERKEAVLFEKRTKNFRSLDWKFFASFFQKRSASACGSGVAFQQIRHGLLQQAHHRPQQAAQQRRLLLGPGEGIQFIQAIRHHADLC
jgi:hypothetical protein